MTLNRDCIAVSCVCTPSHRKEIWVKFNENRSKGYGADRNLKGVNPMTLKVDLDLESAESVNGFCTPSH